MIDEIRQFVLDSLTDMNYSIDDIDDDTVLGPAGADVESVALAELAVRAEDRFGVKFDDDDGEMLTGMTVGEFCLAVVTRIQPASAHLPCPGYRSGRTSSRRSPPTVTVRRAISLHLQDGILAAVGDRVPAA
jgi:acyl carrier protein